MTKEKHPDQILNTYKYLIPMAWVFLVIWAGILSYETYLYGMGGFMDSTAKFVLLTFAFLIVTMYRHKKMLLEEESEEEEEENPPKTGTHD